MNTQKLEEETCLICDNENESKNFLKCDNCKKILHSVRYKILKKSII